jgi:molecular chaperone GrpE
MSSDDFTSRRDRDESTPDEAASEIAEDAASSASDEGLPSDGDDAELEADDIDARLEAILGEVADPLADALRERDEYLDNLRRLQAEFENYRKRVVRQSEEVGDRLTGAILERILPALDALDLARAHAGEPSDEIAKVLLDALGQISSLLRDALAKDGLDRIDEVGVEFDPAIHDAVAHEPVEDDEQSGVVVAEVLRPGYRLKGRVIRPAMVKVRG